MWQNVRLSGWEKIVPKAAISVRVFPTFILPCVAQIVRDRLYLICCNRFRCRDITRRVAFWE